jgi:hypothetical protein
VSLGVLLNHVPHVIGFPRLPIVDQVHQDSSLLFLWKEKTFPWSFGTEYQEGGGSVQSQRGPCFKPNHLITMASSHISCFKRIKTDLSPRQLCGAVSCDLPPWDKAHENSCERKG